LQSWLFVGYCGELAEASLQCWGRVTAGRGGAGRGGTYSSIAAHEQAQASAMGNAAESFILVVSMIWQFKR